MRGRRLESATGLAGRLAATLALALTPVGIIAVSQSAQISEEIARRRESTLLALTGESAADMTRLLSEARGAVEALTAQLSDDGISPYSCSVPFQALTRLNPTYTFAGYINAEGQLICSSAQVGRDVSSTDTFLKMQAAPELRVVMVPDASISGTTVIATVVPRFVDGTYMGYVALSFPHVLADHLKAGPEVEVPIDLITFNADGEILSSHTDLATAASRLPSERALSGFIGRGQVVFQGRTAGGEDAIFAVTPMSPGEAYALGVWTVTTPALAGLPPWVFPTTMILTGLFVAWFATNTFFIRHIRVLQRNMEAFAQTRRLDELAVHSSQPNEIRAMNRTWHEIAQRLLMDEAVLEGALREKNVLLKEIHHRVKNNLQLIASIVSMKLRRAVSHDARAVLKEVQMRVMSIAAVHRSLYLTTDEGKVHADDVLAQVVNTTIEAGAVTSIDLTISQHFDPVVLYPDQAVPLSLFASEAVTNALKYIGRRKDGSADLKISLIKTGEERSTFTVENSIGTPFLPPEQVKGSGLGTSLLHAFANQVNGTFTFGPDGETFRASVDFATRPFDEASEAVTDLSDQA